MPAAYRQNSHSAVTAMHPVTRRDVVKAKCLMAGGLSMRETADALNVLVLDLDRNLFAWLGFTSDEIESIGRRPRARA